MPKLLSIGARVVFEGEVNKTGTVVDYVSDQGTIKGYRVKLDSGETLICDVGDPHLKPLAE